MTDRKTREPTNTVLPAGARAPSFSLGAGPGRIVSLNDLLGKPAILAFYPADFSPVCGDQMVLYNEVLPDFREYGAELYGISVDGVWCHSAFAKQKNIHFSLLSDFEPKGAVSRLFGAYREADGTSERALFVLDADGVIRWSYLSPIEVNPGADGILKALGSLPQAGSGARSDSTRAAPDNASEARP